MRDLELTREFAQTARKVWATVGLRKGYQSMADLATEPRWRRNEGPFGENANLAADIIREVVLGFQGGKNRLYRKTNQMFPGIWNSQATHISSMEKD